MSRPRFLTDQDFNDIIIRGVERLEPSIDFLRIRDVGLAEAPDAEVLAYAAANGWLVLSHDVNTMIAVAYEQFARGQLATGLLMVRQQAAVARIIDEVVMIWAASEAEEWHNQVRFLPL